MCPQAAAPAVTIVAVVSNRIHSNSRRFRQHQPVASKHLLKKRLCIHPTTMFRIAAKINAGLIRSPKMVKYSPCPVGCATDLCLPVHHHHC